MKNLHRHRCLLVSFCAAVAFSFLALSLPTGAAVTEAWVQRYNSTNNAYDAPTALVMDGSGNIVVTGLTGGGGRSFYTAKYAGADGVLLWQQRNYPTNHDDSALALALDGNGDVIVAGYSNLAPPPGFRPDYYTTKRASLDGALLWEQRYSSNSTFSVDFVTAVATDHSNNVIVTGSSGTIKYAGSNGALLWEQHLYNGWALTVDQSNNVIVTGIYGTMKYAAAAGALLWEQRTNAGLAVVVDTNGDIVMVGGPWNPNTLTHDFYAAKYAGTNGGLLWEKRVTAGTAIAVAIDHNNDVVVTGHTYKDGPPYDDYYTAKYAGSDGALLWEKSYNGLGNNFDRAHGLALDDAGNAVVTGVSYGGNFRDYYTTKYAASDGSVLWEKRYFRGYPCTNCIAVGHDGTVAVAGLAEDPGPYVDFATVVYRETLPPLSFDRISNGVRFRFPGVANKSYNIERTFTPTGPWSTNTTLTALTNGILEYIDTNAPPGSAFYRTSTGP